jgi:hypothetical protein
MIESCPVLVGTPALWKELRPQLRKMGILFPQQLPEFLKSLDRHEDRKLRKLRASDLIAFSTRQRRPFVGSLKDDIHLYEAALHCDGFVVTRDPGHHAASRAILAATGVRVIRLDDIVD